MMLQNIVKLARPKQWIKNFFIFSPLFFDKKITALPFLFNTVIAFVSFSLVASAIYSFNDIQDIEADRIHPKKRNRPLASGAVNKVQAYFFIFFLLAASFTILFVSKAPIRIMYVMTFYLALNIAYCLKLKHVAVVDVAIIATGFVLRVVIGSVSADAPLSHWIIIMTFLIALFLAFAKRRDDYLLFIKTGEKPRDNINRYNKEYIDTVLSIVIATMIVSYMMYTVSPEVINRVGSKNLYITSFFVILGTLRYLQLTIVDQTTGSPTEIVFKDIFIQSTLFGWVFLFAYFLYF